MGFRLRVVERTGRNILSNYKQTNSWKGLQCGRDECVTCHQGGEELPDCTRAGVVYESICLQCNPGAVKKGELEKVKDGTTSLYMLVNPPVVSRKGLENIGEQPRRGRRIAIW